MGKGEVEGEGNGELLCSHSIVKYVSVYVHICVNVYWTEIPL